jgi:alkaline phosphatase
MSMVNVPSGVVRGVVGAIFLAAMGLSAGARPLAAATPPHGASDVPRNVILFIGDGVGTAYWTAVLFERGALAVAGMPVAGLTDTRSADDIFSDYADPAEFGTRNAYITDSAAGATVYSAGQRTYNGAIGVGLRCRELFAADSAAVMRDPASCDPLEGVFDVAYRRGIGTGLVATSSVTHATPAAFGAKVPYRRMQAEIAAQLAANPIDVLLGGGRGWFDGTLRPDGQDLLTGLCASAACLHTAEELAAYSPDGRRLVGLFGEDGMERAPGRTPTLPELTRVAIDKLALNPNGFFLMVEGSQPDWRGHDNASLSETLAEMVDFDDAIAAGLEFARRTPGTLVLVVADHETGGLSLVADGSGYTARYSTGNHTGEMTPHFAFGPGAERFSGIRRNDEIGRVLLEFVRAP